MLSFNDLALRRKQAVKAVDSVLYRKARTLPASLRANHPARLEPWRMSLHDDGGVLIRHTPDEFARLAPLPQYVEIARAETEALLVHEQMGYVLLRDSEREELSLRSLGILPAAEAARFDEVAACHDLSPKHVMIDIPHFLASIKAIEASYGLGTALGYGLLLIAGVRSRPEMVNYGELIQALFDQLTLAPSVAATLARISETGISHASPPLQLAVLTQLREQLWKTIPRKAGIEFRLTRVLEAAMKAGTGSHPGHALSASNLGLVALDTVVLAKLGFHPRLLAADANLYLEIALPGIGPDAGAEKSIYWESASAAPLSHVPLQAGRKTDPFELLSRSYHQIGVWNSRQGQMLKAITAFRQALACGDTTPSSVPPYLPETYHELGQAYLRSNQPKEAIAACQHAVALAPGLAEAYIPLASAFLARNRIGDAIETLKKAIRIKPNLAEAFNNLGFAYDQNGESERAITAYKTAVRLRPDYVQAHYNLGNTYLAAGQDDLAIAAYKTAVRLNPSYVRAHYNLGQAYYQHHLLDEALEAYKKVLRINPKHAGALYNLGIIYRDKGMTDKAVEVLQKAVELNPSLLR